MTLIWANPFDIHFGDQKYEKIWTKKNVEEGIKSGGWREINTQALSKELILSVIKDGIVDPIIVYSVTRDLYLQQRILKDIYLQPNERDFDPVGFYCWRGTQRLRLARLLNYETIKCLLLDEKVETPPPLDEVQKYFKKPIQLFIEPNLKRWDVMGVTEDGTIAKQIIY